LNDEGQEEAAAQVQVVVAKAGISFRCRSKNDKNNTAAAKTAERMQRKRQEPLGCEAPF